MSTIRPQGQRQPGDVTAFVNRVMAVVAAEPVPTPTRTFALAVRGRSMHDAAAAVATAWHLATLPGSWIGPRVRMRSLALVLGVAAVLATGGSLAAAAAVRVVEHATSNDQGAIVNEAGAGKHRAPQNVQSDLDEPGPTEHKPAEPDDKSATEEDADDEATGDEPEAADDDDQSSGPSSEGADDEDAHEADEPGSSGEADDDEATDDPEESTPDDETEDDSEEEEADESEQDSEEEEADETGDAEDDDESEVEATDTEPR